LADQVGTAIAHATLQELELARQQAKKSSASKRVSGEYLHELAPLNGMLGFKADPGGHGR